MTSKILKISYYTLGIGYNMVYRKRAPKRKMMKKRVPKSTKALVKAVAKKVVSDALEDKYCTSTTGNIGGVPTYFNASIGTNAEVYRCLPEIFEGVASNQRVGDKIKPKRLRVDFVITANGSYNSSQLNQVRLFVLQDKSIRNVLALKDVALTQIGTPIGSQLLDLGGTLTGFLGQPYQIMSRVNRERYTVFKDQVFELCSGTGQTPQAGNTYNGTQTFVSGQQCWRASVNIPCPAVLKYSNSVDTFPTNFAPFFCLGYTQPDGNATPDNILTRVAVNWVIHLDYEDA